MEHLQDVDRRAETEARLLLAAAFETVPAGPGRADRELAGAELLRQVRRRTSARRWTRPRVLAPAGAVAALAVAAAVALATTLTATVATAPPAAAAVTAAAAKTSGDSFQVTGRSTLGDQQFQVTGAFNPALGIGQETGPGGLQIIDTGQYTYVHAQKAIPGADGKTWVRIAELTGHAPNPVKLLSASLLGVVRADPETLLALLKSGGTVDRLGSASGPGWTGTEYAFTSTGTSPVSIVGTVDVDQHGWVRELAVTLSSPQSGGTVTDVRVDLAFGDFGVPVSVTPPPASEVYIPTSGSKGGPAGGPPAGPGKKAADAKAGSLKAATSKSGS